MIINSHQCWKHGLTAVLLLGMVLPSIALAQPADFSIPVTSTEIASTTPGAITSTTTRAITLPLPPDANSPFHPAARTFTKPLPLSERTQARVTNLAANISTRIETAIERHTNIANRLEARIIIMKKDGVNTSQAEEFLRQARLQMVNSKAAMAKIDNNVHDAVTASDARTAWETVRLTYLRAASSIQQTQFTLLQAINALRSSTNATTTTTTQS